MNVYVSKKHWASLLWGVLLITNECMWTKQGKHHWGVYKNTLRHETLFQTKTRPGLSLFHEGILPLIDLSWSTWVESFPKHLSQSHQCWHLTPAWLEPERAAQIPHSSTTMLHNPTFSNQVLVSDTFNSNTWDIDNWKNETLQHETCKLNLPCPPEPIGNPDISLWGDAAHSGMGLHLAWLLDRRKQPQIWGKEWKETHFYINTCFNILKHHSSEECICPYISLMLLVCWLTWLVTEQHTYERSLKKKHLSTLLLVTTCYTPDIPPYIILLGYHFYIFLNPLHLFSPLWWPRCRFNLQTCRKTKQARSTCVVANLLGMQGTENLVWANDLLKGDQDTANMISSMSHQKNINEQSKRSRDLN